MSDRSDIVVAIPARDEQDSIAATLRGIYASVQAAGRRGLVRRLAVEVTAHRCADDTADRARGFLVRRRGQVTVDDVSTSIGAIRDSAVRRGIDRIAGDPGRCWVLSTDADTLVGRDWVTQILRRAEAQQATVVVGTTDLDRWHGSAPGREAYERIVAAGLRDLGPNHQHDHVYGANLAVRADVYLEVGGFPHVVHGEDQLLVDRLAQAGHRLLRTRDVSVTTSGRLVGRAPDGLADLLHDLDERHAAPAGHPEVCQACGAGSHASGHAC